MRPLPIKTIFVMTALCFAPACGDDEATGNDAGMLTSAASCTGSLLVCDDVCVDPDVDPDHCGGCGKACEEAAFCSDGKCVARTVVEGEAMTLCAEGLTLCGESCVSTDDDVAHCGACGTACDDDERCSSGACSTCETDSVEELPAELVRSTAARGDVLAASCAETASPEVAIGFTAPDDGIYSFSTEGSTFNTVLYVLDGACGGDELACDDDGAGALASTVALELKKDQHVVVVVEGLGTQTGEVALAIEAQAATSCCTGSEEPGCAAPDVESCVCAVDDFCCTMAWDEVCVEILRNEGCGECGTVSTATCEAAESGDEVPAVMNGELGDGGDRVAPSCGFEAENDLLFTFTAPQAGTYSFSTEGSTVTDTVMSLIDGAECSDTELACNDDDGNSFSSRITAELTEGQEVMIVVESWAGEEGEVQLQIAAGSERPAFECETAALAGTLPIATAGAATTENGRFSPSCAIAGSSGEALYAFTATEAGRYRFDTRGSEADTILVVLGAQCAGDELACNDDSDLGGLAAILDVDLTAGQNVVLVVDSYDGMGAYDLSVDRLGEVGPVDSDSCCESHAATGCSNAVVETCVCADDDYCCNNAWDDLCVDAVAALDCGTCD